MASKIYTRTGDKGTTSLIGGTKIPKNHIRIESYGTTDELNSFIGLLSDQLAIAPASPAVAHSVPSAAANSADPDSQHSSGYPHSADQPSTPHSSSQSAVAVHAATSLFGPEIVLLREIQDRLFTIGSSLACDPEKEPKLKIPDLKKEDIQKLEEEIDRMNEVLPPMRSFVLPGGHIAVSTAHIARCVCRRAERICVDMQEGGLFIEPLVLQYLNRLSDYLFMLARYTSHLLHAPEIPWRPRV
jgi:cob(I)alamin adenosyltransferase